MDTLSTSIPFLIIIIIVSLWIRWRKKKLSLFSDLGIPGPTPSFWMGNLKELIEKGYNCESEWIKKYGKIVGYYFGTRPVLLVADPELLKIIQVKEFNDFMNKDVFVPYAGVSAKEMKYAIGLQKDKKWKFIRSLVTPSFSVGKLKNMMPIFNDSIEVFLEKISKKVNEKTSFDIYPIYKKMVLDIITKSAFGISTNVQTDENNIYLKSVLRVLNNGSSNILNFISLCFPETEPIPTFLKISIDKLRSIMGLPSVKMLIDICEKVIEKRKSNPEVHRPDLLQSLIDSGISKQELASIKMDDLAINDDINEQIPKDQNQSQNNIQFLTNEEIKANAMVFIIAGYDTTSSLLAFISHFLINNPNIQDKIRKEIMEHIESKEQLNYENLSKFAYLDQVCSETLRMFPPITNFTNRVSSKQFHYKNMTIPKNITIQAAMWYMQRDANYWTEPEHFNPNRFSSENKSKLNQWMYQPFGMGPRNCVGMRMAMIIVKLTLSHLLFNYTLLPSDETNSELVIDPKLFVNYPKNGVKVVAVSNCNN